MASPDQVAIVAREVGVRFDLRLNRHRTLRRSFGEWFERRRNGTADGKQFWALRDVSFEAHEGEILGVIGRNGSGKSTLLLCLAGILRPDVGSIQTFGKKATLLTLGAGFQPDLTGRDNVYLNGALFGFSKRKMDERLAEIVEFSELGDFIDVPLRKYSSGMRSRLGFSIAVHIDPDVLLLDEVLGVGDESFKRKSKAKLLEFMSDAKAIAVVTHSMPFVREVCTNALWLDQGRVAEYGAPEQVVASYVASAEQDQGPVRSVS